MDKNRQLKICQWNARGVASKQGELQYFLSVHVPDIVCIQETHLNPRHHNFNLSGYNIVRSDRRDNTRAGVLIAMISRVDNCLYNDNR